MPGGAPTLLNIYGRLEARFGSQGWWPAETPFEVMVGAILTQRTTWRGASRAIENLKRAGLLTPAALAAAPAEELEDQIREAGFFRQKASRLRGMARAVAERYGGDVERAFRIRPTDELRRELLSWRGVGPETADAILLYAAGRPVFPVDLYTVRLLERLGLDSGGYEAIQRLIVSQMPLDTGLYKELHALIDELGKNHCRTRPRCAGCPLADICRFASGGKPGEAGWAAEREGTGLR